MNSMLLIPRGYIVSEFQINSENGGPLSVGDPSASENRRLLHSSLADHFAPSILVTHAAGDGGEGGSKLLGFSVIGFFPLYFCFLLVLLCSARVHRHRISLVPVAFYLFLPKVHPWMVFGFAMDTPNYA